jgi:hypothetical protein
METLFDKINNSSKGWYLISDSSEKYCEILDLSGRGSDESVNFQEPFFIMNLYEKNGDFIKTLQELSSYSWHRYKSISEEDLPWNQNKISEEERATRNRFYSQSDKLFQNENKLNLSETLHTTFDHYEPKEEIAKLAKDVNETAKKNKLNLNAQFLEESIESYRDYMKSFGYSD